MSVSPPGKNRAGGGALIFNYALAAGSPPRCDMLELLRTPSEERNTASLIQAVPKSFFACSTHASLLMRRGNEPI